MRTAITAACTLALSASLALAAARAADPPAPTTPASSATTKSDPSPSSSKLAADAKPGGKDSMIGGTCLKSTGSRIPVKNGHCVNAPGFVYTQKQIQATGATSTAGALRQLSPALTISH